jgi:protein TonB
MMDRMVFVEVGTGERTRRRTAAITSISLEAMLLMALCIVPFLKVEPPPVLHLDAHPVLTVPQIMQLVMTRSASAPSVGNTNTLEAPRTHPLVVPTTIPHGVSPQGNDPTPLASLKACPSCTGTNPQLPTGLIGPTSATTVHAAPAAPKVIKISHMDEGMLLRRVQPVYPGIAKLARVQGTVILQAMIARDGTIQSLRAVSGSPLLIQAALDAVRQWRYRPYVLNGVPIEVETQITVNFNLSR